MSYEKVDIGSGGNITSTLTNKIQSYHSTGGRGLPNVYTPFITFTVGEGDGAVSLTWRASENRPDYFTSLSYTRYTDKANTGVLNISYNPQPGEDPNRIEAALAGTGGIKPCYFQYGYAGLLMKKQVGMLLDYKITFDNGSLKYSFTLVGRDASYNYVSINNENYSIPSKDNLSTYVSNVNRYVELKQVYDQQGIRYDAPDYNIGDALPSGGIYFGIENASAYTGVNYTLGIMSLILEKYTEGQYKFDIENSAKSFETPADGLSTNGMSPFVALKTIAENLSYADSSLANQYFYEIVIDDSTFITKGYGTVTLKEFKHGNIDAKYVFEWGSKESDVLSWTPQYSGSVLLFANNQEITKDLIVNTKINPTNDTNDDPAGSLELATVIATVPAASAKALVDKYSTLEAIDFKAAGQGIAESINYFNKMGNYPYTGNLTVLGTVNPELNLFDIVEIEPLINKQLHASGGLYLVKAITDNISSAGMTTDLEVVKIAIDELINQDFSITVINGKTGKKETMSFYEYWYHRGTQFIEVGSSTSEAGSKE